MLPYLPKNFRVSTIGIGRSFDEQLVYRVAKEGRGSMSRVYDLSQASKLAKAAVLALTRSMYPSIPGCSMKWTGMKKELLNEVFYNQIVSSYKIVNKREWQAGKIKFTFNCGSNLIRS